MVNFSTLKRNYLVKVDLVEVYIPKNPDPVTLGLMVETSHPQVIGLDRCKPLLDTPGFLGYGECRQLYHMYAS